jgi:hypothetical protein
LRLRLPEWLQREPAIRVNGERASGETQRGFAVIKRRWKSGDTMTFDLPLALRTEAIDDLHPKTVAVLRGPLVYVELNPRPGPAALGHLEKQTAVAGAPGAFVAQAEGSDRVHVPLYAVEEESYTTYFEKS